MCAALGDLARQGKQRLGRLGRVASLIAREERGKRPGCRSQADGHFPSQPPILIVSLSTPDVYLFFFSPFAQSTSSNTTSPLAESCPIGLSIDAKQSNPTRRKNTSEPRETADDDPSSTLTKPRSLSTPKITSLCVHRLSTITAWSTSTLRSPPLSGRHTMRTRPCAS